LAGIPWWAFTALAIGGYVVVNTVFAWVYVLIGVESLDGVQAGTWMHEFSECWFFSAQTITTVGYGHVSPVGWLASSIAALEALTGLLGFGVWTGLLYARFSRPRARILFAAESVVAPHRGATAWMFRMVPLHDHALLEAETSVLFSWVEETPEGAKRRYAELPLEQRAVRFFPMNWTVVHAITEDSPLAGLTGQDLEQVDAEILVLVRAHDESYAQTVHARASWKAPEIRFAMRYASMMSTAPDGAMELDLSRLGALEPTPQA
jgi:inward rectifier potassium channel